MQSIHLRRAKWLFIAAAVISLITSVILWIAGDHDRSLFVGLWVPSILGLGALVFAGRDRA